MAVLPDESEALSSASGDSKMSGESVNPSMAPLRTEKRA